MRYLAGIVNNVTRSQSSAGLGLARIGGSVLNIPVPGPTLRPQPPVQRAACWPVPPPPWFYACPGGAPLQYDPQGTGDGRNCVRCGTGNPMACHADPTQLVCGANTTRVVRADGSACCEPAMSVTGTPGGQFIPTTRGNVIDLLHGISGGLGSSLGQPNPNGGNVSPKTGLPCSAPRVKKVGGVKKEFCYYTDLGELECPGCIKNPMLLR